MYEKNCISHSRPSNTGENDEKEHREQNKYGIFLGRSYVEKRLYHALKVRIKFFSFKMEIVQFKNCQHLLNYIYK